MKENIKFFNTLEEADGYVIKDIPFTGYIKENGWVLFNNDPNKMLINLNGLVIVHDIVDVIFKTLNDADGYIIETIPFSCYIKENYLFLECNLENKMLIVLNGLVIVIEVVSIVFNTLDDADGYIIENIPFSCYIKENYLFLECNLENCKIVVENGGAVIKERGNIIRYTATSKVTPYRSGALPTIISNNFDENIEKGVIKFATDVVSIGWDAFFGCSSLTSVMIPNSVTSIGGSAFSNCSHLTTVTIPNSVASIGNLAFSNCSHLTTVTIPNSVTSIGNYAFNGCTGLTSINVTSDNSNYYSVDGVLFNKDKTTLIQYPGGKQGSYTIPNSVKNIGDHAFQLCTGLTSVMIPNSVTCIGDAAFWNCGGLTSVTIPNSITIIRNQAFDRCHSLTSISYTGTISQYNSITKGTAWHTDVPATVVHCTDGDVNI